MQDPGEHENLVSEVIFSEFFHIRDFENAANLHRILFYHSPIGREVKTVLMKICQMSVCFFVK